jgi:hypothetical protein
MIAIGSEVMIEHERGWVAEPQSDDRWIVGRYTTSEQLIVTTEALSETDDDPPEGWLAVTVERSDGSPLCAVRFDQTTVASLEEIADKLQLPFDAAVRQVLVEAIDAATQAGIIDD